MVVISGININIVNDFTFKFVNIHKDKMSTAAVDVYI